jgi:hypothetical protein
MNTILSWFRQPTTVAGFSTLIGTAMGVATGSVNASTALSLAVGSLVAMLVPDNTAAVQASKMATGDLVTLGEALVKKPTIVATSSVPPGGKTTP